MIVPQYVPGHWFAVVTDGSIALLSPQTPPAVVHQVWDGLRDGGSIEEQRDALVAHDGVVLPFALATVSAGRLRAYLRGDVELDIHPDGGDDGASGPDGVPAPGAVVRRCTGIGEEPWVHIEDAAPASLSVAAPAREGGRMTTAVALPVLAGVVCAVRVGLELRAQQPGHAEPGADDAVIGAAVDAPAAAAPPVPPPPPAPAVVPDVAPELEAGEEHLYADTVLNLAELRSAPGLAGPQHPDTPSPAPVRTVAASALRVAEEDHDGMTIMSSDLVEIRRSLPTLGDAQLPGPFAVPTEVAPAKLVLSSGQVVTLDRTVLIGRAPIVSRVSNRDLPRLVTVDSPNHDVSRTHARVRAEGDRVFVTDLDSTNGVTLARAGQEPERIRPGVETVVPVGAVVDLGDGATFEVVRHR
ncbi:MAG: FHA domain-containing protein [Cellulomonadaceae bacterium]